MAVPRAMWPLPWTNYNPLKFRQRLCPCLNTVLKFVLEFMLGSLRHCLHREPSQSSCLPCFAFTQYAGGADESEEKRSCFMCAGAHIETLFESLGPCLLVQERSEC